MRSGENNSDLFYYHEVFFLKQLILSKPSELSEDMKKLVISLDAKGFL